MSWVIGNIQIGLGSYTKLKAVFIGLSPVRTGLKMGKLTGQMGSSPILSPMRTAQEVFLPGNLPDSDG
jgi:hypothetical protein